ncbi:MAG: hypothetical protein XD53_1411 [Petrotoga mobilis]|jgi:hypothetical protein|nr:MAG: hypothetical protein XD53_1411 [Petrotoga mobilis]
MLKNVKGDKFDAVFFWSKNQKKLKIFSKKGVVSMDSTGSFIEFSDLPP